ncbi:MULTISPECIES: hypothetical protein [Pseudomonas]|uniref:Toxin n=1 Tax=Pseudomonas chlororaphis TaxID=587753 RepID=A0A0D5XXK6_9PSED|nr:MULTISPECIES: hypothetical protein [Pseudomonas]AJO79485.1 toxin [Pseudomonas sp. MRSN 12121]AKA23796.1 toxin [Pseudomonas chlororaphis]MCB2252375.1 type II toxin-antitoxin system RelE/ParE family toxin [Pseudomonas chlororaphis]
MDALFIELPPFQRHRQGLLDDELFHSLQLELLKNPQAGDLIEGTGGLRKLRFVDERRHKGKRSGIRVIYYCWCAGAQFWLFTLYAKNQQDDLAPHQKKLLKHLLNQEIEARTQHET